MIKITFLSVLLIIFGGFQSCVDKSRTFYEKGVAHFENKNYKDAILEFNQAIEEDTNFSEAYYKRGVANIYLEGYESAINDFNKAVELDPENTFLLVYRGDAYGQTGEYNKALTDYKTVLEINSHHFQARFNRGLLFNLINDYENAKKDFDIIIQSNTDHAPSYNYRSYSLLKLGMLNEALADVNKSIEMLENPMAFRNRALIYFAMDSTDKACLNLTFAIDTGFGEKFGSEAQDLFNLHCR